MLSNDLSREQKFLQTKYFSSHLSRLIFLLFSRSNHFEIVCVAYTQTVLICNLCGITSDDLSILISITPQEHLNTQISFQLIENHSGKFYHNRCRSISVVCYAINNVQFYIFLFYFTTHFASPQRGENFPSLMQKR